jgi:hypothetical protein
MATNESRSLNQSLSEGSTDGKYRKVAPNRTVDPGMGDEITSANRRGLHPYWNYDYIEQEASVKVAPGSMSTSGKARSAGADKMYDDEMGANY